MPSSAPTRPAVAEGVYSIMSAQYGGDRPQPRISTRHHGERAGPSRGRRLRRGRARRALRDSGLHLRRGRHAGARAGLHRGLCGPHRRLRGDLRVEGAPDHRRLQGDGRGGPVGRRRVRRRAVSGAARPESTRSASSCTATTRPRPSCGSRSTSGIGYLVLDSFAEIERAERLLEPRRAGRADPGHARDQALHPHLHPDRPARLEVRLRPRGRARARRRCGACRRPSGSSWSASTPTSARRSSSSSRTRRRSSCSPTSSTSTAAC